MNIYVVQAHGSRSWDEFLGFVIVAPSTGAARRLAGMTAAPYVSADPIANHRHDERKFWDDPEKTSVVKVGTYIGKETAPHVVLSSFKNG